MVHLVNSKIDIVLYAKKLRLNYRIFNLEQGLFWGVFPSLLPALHFHSGNQGLNLTSLPRQKQNTHSV